MGVGPGGSIPGGCRAWEREGQPDKHRALHRGQSWQTAAGCQGAAEALSSQCLIIAWKVRRESAGLGEGEVWECLSALFQTLPSSPAHRDSVMKWKRQGKVPQQGPRASGFLLLLVLGMELQMPAAAAVAFVDLPSTSSNTSGMVPTKLLAVLLTAELHGTKQGDLPPPPRLLCVFVYGFSGQSFKVGLCSKIKIEGL